MNSIVQEKICKKTVMIVVLLPVNSAYVKIFPVPRNHHHSSYTNSEMDGPFFGSQRPQFFNTSRLIQSEIKEQRELQLPTINFADDKSRNHKLCFALTLYN